MLGVGIAAGLGSRTEPEGKNHTHEETASSAMRAGTYMQVPRPTYYESC